MTLDHIVDSSSPGLDHVTTFNAFFNRLLFSEYLSLHPGLEQMALHLPQHEFFIVNQSSILKSLGDWQEQSYKRIVVNSGSNYSWEVLSSQKGDGVMQSIAKDEWFIPNFWVNEHILGMQFDYDGGISSKDNTLDPNIINSIISLLSGQEVDNRIGEEMVRDIEITRDDLQKGLSQILAHIQSSNSASILEGRILSFDEMVALAENLRIVYAQDKIVEFGVSKIKYLVAKHTALSTEENPEGFYIYDDYGKFLTIKFPVKLTLASGISGYLLCSTLIRKDIANYESGSPFDINSEAVKGFSFVSSVRIADDINEYITNMESLMSERKFVTELMNVVVNMYITGTIDNYNLINYDLLANEYSAEDLKAEFDILFSYRIYPQFAEMSQQIAGALAAYSERLANVPYLLMFLSEYLATKVILGKITIEEILRRISEGDFTWFSSLESCIVYLVRENGYRKILLKI